ncbi:MAG: glycosyltransferase family 4 protein [Cytophagales bacterium]|nr:glycosyltransferase family 4 protein [Cytophagales bacterium]
MMNKSKTKIVIASVLKPVDDVRNYEKIATSLFADENNEITVLGTQSQQDFINRRINTRAWEKFQRLSFGRIQIQGEYWRTLKEVKPDLIIFTTFELLFVSVIFRARYGSKLVYDVQEDYLKNLWHQHFYPFGIRHILGVGIRTMELLFSPFISGYLLAEKIYEKDMPAVSNKSIILENKSLPFLLAKKDTKFKVVFTGTISAYSRALESIELYFKIKNQLPDSSMTVIGYAPNLHYLKLIKNRYSDLPEIEFKLSSDPVPHSDIVKEISTARLAIIGYFPNPVNEGKIPTKLYEYTAAKLPYLVQENTLWSRVGCEFGIAIPVDFKDPLSDLIIRVKEIEKAEHASTGYRWAEQEDLLIEFINNIVS